LKKGFVTRYEKTTTEEEKGLPPQCNIELNQRGGDVGEIAKGSGSMGEIEERKGPYRERLWGSSRKSRRFGNSSRVLEKGRPPRYRVVMHERGKRDPLREGFIEPRRRAGPPPGIGHTGMTPGSKKRKFGDECPHAERGVFAFRKKGLGVLPDTCRRGSNQGYRGRLEKGRQGDLLPVFSGKGRRHPSRERVWNQACSKNTSQGSLPVKVK